MKARGVASVLGRSIRKEQIFRKEQIVAKNEKISVVGDSQPVVWAVGSCRCG